MQVREEKVYTGDELQTSPSQLPIISSQARTMVL
jgi:hypothetical protein